MKTIIIINPNTNKIGKIVAQSKPILRLPPAKFAKKPTSDGPVVPPISPAKAKIANITVPPVLNLLEERLIVPGHIIPTDIPQIAQPNKLKIGKFDKDANK